MKIVRNMVMSSAEIRTRIQIPNVGNDLGILYDTYDKWKLLYISSDNFFNAPSKGFESTSYPEQEGENIDARTVDAPFDYTVVFLVCCENSGIENANKYIAEFNKALYTQSGDIKTYKTITFYNDYKKVKIVGVPTPLSEAKEYWRDNTGMQYDAVKVELKIRVTKPSLCDFNLK